MGIPGVAAAQAAPAGVLVHVHGHFQVGSLPAPVGTVITAVGFTSGPGAQIGPGSLVSCGTGTVSDASGAFALDITQAANGACVRTRTTDPSAILVFTTAGGMAIGSSASGASLDVPNSLGRPLGVDLSAPPIPGLTLPAGTGSSLLLGARLYGQLTDGHGTALPVGTTIEVSAQQGNGNAVACGSTTVLDANGSYIADLPLSATCINGAGATTAKLILLRVNGLLAGSSELGASSGVPVSLGRPLNLPLQVAPPSEVPALPSTSAPPQPPVSTPIAGGSTSANCPPNVICGSVQAYGGTQTVCTLHGLAVLVFDRYNTNQPIGVVPLADQPNTYLVIVSGTELFNPDQTTNLIDDVLNWTANEPFQNSYEQNILQALQGAGVPADGSAHLILAGHSLGGMALQNLVADDAAFSGVYTADELVTFGSPQTADEVPGTSYVRVDADLDPIPRLGPLQWQLHDAISVAATGDGFDGVANHGVYPTAPELYDYDVQGNQMGLDVNGQPVGACITLNMDQFETFGAPVPS